MPQIVCDHIEEHLIILTKLLELSDLLLHLLGVVATGIAFLRSGAYVVNAKSQLLILFFQRRSMALLLFIRGGIVIKF